MYFMYLKLKYLIISANSYNFIIYDQNIYNLLYE